jgi:hypothetical protein
MSPGHDEEENIPLIEIVAIIEILGIFRSDACPTGGDFVHHLNYWLRAGSVFAVSNMT